MTGSTPVWTAPLPLALVGITMLVGNLSVPASIVIGLETLAYAAYVIVRGRVGEHVRPVANVLPLVPAHLLLLLAISLLPRPGLLPWLWALLPPASIAYDALSVGFLRTARGTRSILSGLYAIIWADLFVLLERVVSLKREFSPSGEIVASVAFGVIGGVFIWVGICRHRRANNKE